MGRWDSNTRIGFIGAGHMGGILAGIVCRTAGCENVAVACSCDERSKAVAERLGCRWDTVCNILKNSEIIFIGLRPAQLDAFVSAYRSEIEGVNAVFVSMLSGVKIAALEEKLGADKKMIRIMPNTPSEIGKGLIGYTCNEKVSAAELQKFTELLIPAGLIEELPESEMDIFSVIAACAPAYAYFFADALAKGGERCGIDKEKAIRYAAQMLAGSAGMMLKGDKTPEALMNEVCTPGGTTIEGVNKMKKGGFENLLADAVTASYNKTVGKI